jgi:very-short-patch-repair endonuclease
VRAGLPEPELNWTLRSEHGRFVARLDLAYPEYKVCVEYDGRQHAEGAQFLRDADRWADIEAEGWITVRVLSHHLADPRGVVARVTRALRSRGWR